MGGIFGKRWRIKIGPIEIKTDAPHEAIRKQAERTGESLGKLAEAVATQDISKLKEAIGELVVEHNLVTSAGKALVKEVFPRIRDDQFERAVGAGVLGFFSTGSPLLTVLAIGEQAYEEYTMAEEPVPAPPISAPSSSSGRMHKEFSVQCTSLTRWTKPDGKIELWAGFADAPLFVASDGSQFIWPSVDINKGDSVKITAVTNFILNDGKANFYTIPEGVGLYSFPSTATPGPGREQVKQTLVFDFIV